MPVMKATVSLDVFFEADDLASFKKASLEEILYHVDVSDWIASSPTKSAPVAVPCETLQAELAAIGDDGSFFENASKAGPKP